MNDLFDGFFRGKRVLITGDTGFKGSWLAIWLEMLGARVTGVALPPQHELDNYIVTGLADEIAHINQDIRDLMALQQIFNDNKPDIVLHLAAQALVLESYREPVTTFETNILGTVNVLETIRNTDSVKAAVIITTDKCYENREWIYGYRENDRLGGKDPYSASKAACEIVTNAYVESFFKRGNKAAVATARAGNVIGGGDWAENRIFPDCISALEKGESIRIRNPFSVRPWQHVLEPLSGYLQLAKMLYTAGEKFSGPWNFGPVAGNMVNVETLVKEIISHYGSGNYFPEPVEHAAHEAGLLTLDISKARNFLNWQPRLNFQQSVAMAVREYKLTTEDTKKNLQQRMDDVRYYMELE